MIVSFLYATFIHPNVRTIPQAQVAAQLDDHLHLLRAQHGEDKFPRSSTQYLDAWASDEHGWLRKYYPPDDDEPWFDITPATEKAIEWLHSLKQRQFVGTESRLRTVFELLRQIVEGSERDPDVRVAELQKRRDAIEAEIAAVRAGHAVVMEDTQIKDRFLQLSATARGLLSDFREVEQNFRSLDRDVRTRIATWDGSRGTVLDGVFGERDAITESDQGRSFRAFWDFLMHQARQDEFTSMLEAVFALRAVQELSPDRRLMRIHHDWLEAGEVAQRTIAKVSAQLRRYLDDQRWLENRRITQLIRAIEGHAMALRDDPPAVSMMALDDAHPTLELPMERPLFAPPSRSNLADQVVEEGGVDVPADALFDQVYVDRARLEANIRRLLQSRAQVSLRDVVSSFPLEQGLAELVAYLSLAADDERAVIDERDRDTIEWATAADERRSATMPRVVFTSASYR